MQRKPLHTLAISAQSTHSPPLHNLHTLPTSAHSLHLRTIYTLPTSAQSTHSPHLCTIYTLPPPLHNLHSPFLHTLSISTQSTHSPHLGTIYTLPTSAQSTLSPHLCTIHTLLISAQSTLSPPLHNLPTSAQSTLPPPLHNLHTLPTSAQSTHSPHLCTIYTLSPPLHNLHSPILCTLSPSLHNLHTLPISAQSTHSPHLCTISTLLPLHSLALLLVFWPAVTKLTQNGQFRPENQYDNQPQEREKWRNPNRKDNADCKRKRYGQKTIRERNSCANGFMRIIKWSFIHCIIVINWTDDKRPHSHHDNHITFTAKQNHSCSMTLHLLFSACNHDQLRTWLKLATWTADGRRLGHLFVGHHLTVCFSRHLNETFMHSPSKCTLMMQSQQTPLSTKSKPT